MPMKNEAPSRRSFLDLTVRTLGGAAAASLLTAGARNTFAAAGAAAAARSAFSRQGQARHLPAHGRRPVADGPLRLQAEDGRHVRQGPAGLHPQRPAADGNDQRSGAISHRPVQVQVQAVRQVRHVGQRAAAEHGQDGRRDVFHPQHEHRRHQSRAGHHLRPDRQSGRRQALPRLVGLLRAGHAQPEPAGLRRHGGQVDQPRAASGHLRQALDQRLPAGRACRRRLPHERRSDPLHQQSARRVCRTSAA